MTHDNLNSRPLVEDTPDEVIHGELLAEPVYVVASRPPRRRRLWLPLVLFVVTCLSTWFAGTLQNSGLIVLVARMGGAWQELLLAAMLSAIEGLKFAVPLMTILVCHEAGHFIQTRRYGVYASFPYFIPMPISPLGTLGAVIGMEAHMGHRRALFDIGISGPLAGLVPTLIFSWVGLTLSTVRAIDLSAERLGEPLLFTFLSWLHFGAIQPGYEVYLHPTAFAGWVGLLLTSVNLMPIGQLDGGHVAYSLLRRKAHVLARCLLLTAIVVVGGCVAMGNKDAMGWIVMLFLLILMGPAHPPTADDYEPLGRWRTILGWLTLAFVIIGFTPTPFILSH